MKGIATTHYVPSGTPRPAQTYLAEAIGTFALVFAGTGAIIINDASGGAVTHVGIGITFGLVVMAVIYAIGEVSGAHINPAVTIGFAVAGKFSWRRVPPYLAAQCAGAFAASLVLRTLFPEHPTLGGTVPAGSAMQSFVLEIILTFILMFVVLCTATGAKEKGIMAGAAIAGTVAFEALFAGPISGASMNPVRSIAPAVISGNLADLWVYIAAPIVGAIGAVAAFYGTYGTDRKHSSAPTQPEQP